VFERQVQSEHGAVGHDRRGDGSCLKRRENDTVNEEKKNAVSKNKKKRRISSRHTILMNRARCARDTRTCGFGGREQLEPILHYGGERVHSDFGGARHQPADHLASPPVQRGQRDAHHLRRDRKKKH